MRRIVQLLMLFLVLGQAVGLDRVLGDSCQPGCEDEADGRKCPPVCPSCTCSLRSAPVVAPTSPEMVVLATARPVTFCETERTPFVPEPREILHVPIAPRV